MSVPAAADRIIRSVLIAIAALIVAASAAAQGGGPPPRQGDAAGASVSPGEIQRMFDSYALMQAQEQLEISDDQFPQFLTRFKALQAVRHRALQARVRTIIELRRLLNQPQPDETAVRARVTALDEIEARAQADSGKALEAIDQVLTVQQQAKFRIFEELMERRKLELVNRARQANRARQK